MAGAQRAQASRKPAHGGLVPVHTPPPCALTGWVFTQGFPTIALVRSLQLSSEEQAFCPSVTEEETEAKVGEIAHGGPREQNLGPYILVPKPVFLVLLTVTGVPVICSSNSLVLFPLSHKSQRAI